MGNVREKKNLITYVGNKVPDHHWQQGPWSLCAFTQPDIELHHKLSESVVLIEIALIVMHEWLVPSLFAYKMVSELIIMHIGKIMSIFTDKSGILVIILAHLTQKLRMSYYDHSPSVSVRPSIRPSTPFNVFNSSILGPILFKLHDCHRVHIW